jgi:hypothetical protein
MTSLTYAPLAMALGSMLEDPIIDLSLQENYHFNLAIQYRRGIDIVKSKGKSQKNQPRTFQE